MSIIPKQLRFMLSLAGYVPKAKLTKLRALDRDKAIQLLSDLSFSAVLRLPYTMRTTDVTPPRQTGWT